MWLEEENVRGFTPWALLMPAVFFLKLTNFLELLNFLRFRNFLAIFLNFFPAKYFKLENRENFPRQNVGKFHLVKVFFFHNFLFFSSILLIPLPLIPFRVYRCIRFRIFLSYCNRLQFTDLCTSLRKKWPYLELFWSKFGKIRTRITPNTDTFHAVCLEFWYLNHESKEEK